MGDAINFLVGLGLLGNKIVGKKLAFFSIVRLESWDGDVHPQESGALAVTRLEIIILLTPALLCHKEPAQGTQTPLLGALGRNGVFCPLWHKGATYHAITTHQKQRKHQPMRAQYLDNLDQ